LNKYDLTELLSLRNTTILLDKFINCSKEIELNIRYDDPVFILKELVKERKAKIHVGTDSHSVKELYNYWHMLFQKEQ